MKSRRFILLFLTPLLSACVVYPREVNYYDYECKVEAKKLILETNFDNLFWLTFCQGEGCENWLLVQLGVTAVETVVSGSVVVVGNTIFWLEKQAECRDVPVPVPQPDPVANTLRANHQLA